MKPDGEHCWKLLWDDLQRKAEANTTQVCSRKRCRPVHATEPQKQCFFPTAFVQNELVLWRNTTQMSLWWENPVKLHPWKNSFLSWTENRFRIKNSCPCTLCSVLSRESFSLVPQWLRCQQVSAGMCRYLKREATPTNRTNVEVF